MSVEFESFVEGIPAIGFSLCDFSYSADFEAAKEYIQKIVLESINQNMPKGMVLNVNIPKLPKEELKGIKVCRQANAIWRESYEERVNPRGRTYYWQIGRASCRERVKV